MDLALITYNSWYAIKPNQTKPNQKSLPDSLKMFRFDHDNIINIKNVK